MSDLTRASDLLRSSRIWAGLSLLSVCLSATAVEAHSSSDADGLSTVVDFHIAPQPLEKALLAFSRQARIQLEMDTSPNEGGIAPAVNGAFEAKEALSLLLQGAKLNYKRVGNTIAITQGEPLAQYNPSNDQSTGKVQHPAAGFTGDNKKSAESHSSAPNDDILEQILVTAQKRSERLLDVPTAISAVSGDRLESMNVNSLSDLANYVPGLSIQDLGAPGARSIVLRGLNTSFNNDTVASTVATYIDDLPVGPSGTIGRGGQYGVDLPPYEIERIEVLKGPQGTLYGANTLGGVVKYVVRKPDLEQFEARVGTDLGYTNDAMGPNWSVRGVVNFPLVADKLAVRVSGFDKRAAGYIDDIGIKSSNASSQQGGRAALRWRASDTLSVQATALVERDKVDGVTSVAINGSTGRPLYGPQIDSTRMAEPFQLKTQNYSLNINWDLGFAALTSATGWSRVHWSRANDLSYPFGAFCKPGILSPGNPGCVDYPFPDAVALFKYAGNTSKLVEEFRLVSPEQQRIQWMLGGFYTRETTYTPYSFPTFTPSVVPLPDRDNLLISASDSRYEELAGFANLTYQITRQFDISGGVRHSAYNVRSFDAYQTGVIFGNDYTVLPDTTLPSVGVTTWMANTRYHLSEDSTMYARVATGYRPGGGCKFYSDGTPCGIPSLGIPGFFNPDRTTNYETGVKGQFFDHRLQLDAALYYIDWKNIQVPTVTSQGFAYAGNGGKARSKGLELGLEFRMTQALRFNATTAYTDAKLEEDIPGSDGAPAGGGKSGDRLPVSPVWTASLTVDYARSLDAGMMFLAGGGYRYRDAIVNNLSLVGSFPMGPQNIVDMYWGISINKISTKLYVSNVFNNRSYVGVQATNEPGIPRFVPVQPRTIGVSLDYAF